MIAYETRGAADRPWLTLVHGFSQNRRYFTSALSYLEGKFRLLLIDLRGHGMRATFFTVAALASAVLLAGCAKQHDHRATSTATTPNVLTLRPSEMKRAWFRSLRLTQSTPAATGDRADKVAASIRKAAWVPGVRVASANVYSTPALASSLVLQVAKPAYFLRHQLKPILPRLTGNGEGTPYYLLVVDARAKRVLEAYHVRNEGSLYVRPGLERCSPIVAMGWPINLPSCPSK